MVLYAIVSSARKNLSNLRPSIAISFMCCKKSPLFLHRPSILIDFWVQMVMPSFSDLLLRFPHTMVLPHYLGNVSPFA